jgi:hypothetical protein
MFHAISNISLRMRRSMAEDTYARDFEEQNMHGTPDSYSWEANGPDAWNRVELLWETCIKPEHKWQLYSGW